MAFYCHSSGFARIYSCIYYSNSKITFYFENYCSMMFFFEILSIIPYIQLPKQSLRFRTVWRSIMEYQFYTNSSMPILPPPRLFKRNQRYNSTTPTLTSSHSIRVDERKKSHCIPVSFYWRLLSITLTLFPIPCTGRFIFQRELISHCAANFFTPRWTIDARIIFISPCSSFATA